MVNKRVINGVYFEIYKICILILNFVMYSLITNFKWLNVWNLDHNMQKTEQYINKEMEKKVAQNDAYLNLQPFIFR